MPGYGVAWKSGPRGADTTYSRTGVGFSGVNVKPGVGIMSQKEQGFGGKGAFFLVGWAGAGFYKVQSDGRAFMLTFFSPNRCQRGAMFGLDARIALAIFAGLTIIAGAALFSALTRTKAVALLADMNEVLKGAEQYSVDTGRNLAALTAPAATLNFGGLFLSFSTPNWRGPYTNYDRGALDLDWMGSGINTVEHPRYGVMVLTAFTDAAWGSTTESTFDCNAPEGPECYVWVKVSAVPLNMAERLDEMVDGNDGGGVGRLRYVDLAFPSDGADLVWVYLKGNARLR